MRITTTLFVLLASFIPALGATTWPAGTNTANQTFYGTQTFAVPFFANNGTFSGTVTATGGFHGTADYATKGALGGNPAASVLGLDSSGNFTEGAIGAAITNALTASSALNAGQLVGVVAGLTPQIMIPDQVTAVVGDEIQLFVRGMIQAQDPYILPYTLTCTKGSSYPRYFDYTPVLADVGTNTFTVAVQDLSNATIATKAMNIVVVNTNQSPATEKHIFCLGDSLTAGGVWPAELYRRLVATNGTPAGNQFGNITFIGDEYLSGWGTNAFTGIGGGTFDIFNGDGFATSGHVLTTGSDLDKSDVNSTWSDTNGNTWVVGWTMPGQGEVLQNVGFELTNSPTGSTPFNVWNNGGGGPTPQVERVKVHSGSVSAKLTSDNSAWYEPNLFETAAVITGTNYTLSGWAAGDGVHSPQIAIIMTAGPPITTLPYSLGITSTNFTFWHYSFTTSVNCSNIQIYLLPEQASGSYCYFDDLSLRLATKSIKVWSFSGSLSNSGVLTYVSGGTHTSPIAYSSSTTEPASPLWGTTSNAVSFTQWASRNGYSTIDGIYVLAGWNNWSTSLVTYSNAVAKFLNTYHTEYPAGVVRLVGIQVPSAGGLGNNYGASLSLSQYYWTLIAQIGLNKTLQAVANNASYSSFVRYVDIASQFDSENNMQSGAVPVNTRNATTELRGSNGVHPDTTGYYQIADVVWRDFIRTFCQ